MQHKLLSILFLIISIHLLLPSPSHAQQPQPQEFHKAKVIEITKEGTKNIGNTKNIFQSVKIEFLDGPEKGKTTTLEHGGTFTIIDSQKVSSGEEIVITSQKNPDGTTRYAIGDKYRLNALLYILIGFIIFVIAIAGRKGLGAIIGMFLSLAVIVFFIVPQILNGFDPLLISITGSLFILVVTMYLAHGINQKTTIAVGATFLSLIMTAIFAILFVKISKLTGLGSEDIYTLSQGFTKSINFQGLLLGGIIIGSLGVLDDITTTQSAAIHELAKSSPKITFQELFNTGMRIGREHITSLVNTLVLAYAGASIGVFIFLNLGIQNNTQPLWVILNSELIVEEVIRTLAGSMGLILAVPITTLLAAFFAKYSVKIK